MDSQDISKEHKLSFLNLDKPIIFFDLETTGLRPNLDRIIEISCLKFPEEGDEEFRSKRINPEMPICEEAIEVHGIRDEDLISCPTFKQVAKSLHDYLDNCHLGGFGIANFDIKVLQYEFKRAGYEFSLEGRSIIDAKSIFHKNEPRDLRAALQFYCDKELENAHTAKADVDASVDVVVGQFQKYTGALPTDIYDLHNYCNPRKQNYYDKDGKFIWSGGEVSFNFGKYARRKLKEVAGEDKGYLKWIINGDFTKEVKDLVDNALKGKFEYKD